MTERLTKTRYLHKPNTITADILIPFSRHSHPSNQLPIRNFIGHVPRHLLGIFKNLVPRERETRDSRLQLSRLGTRPKKTSLPALLAFIIYTSLVAFVPPSVTRRFPQRLVTFNFHLVPWENEISLLDRSGTPFRYPSISRGSNENQTGPLSLSLSLSLVWFLENF